MNTYEFIKKSNKFLEEWGGEQRPEVLTMWFNYMQQVGCNSKMLHKAVRALKDASENGWDTKEAVDGVVAFADTLDSYKAKFKLELEHAKMRSMLESLLPYELARYEARKIDPESDFAFSKQMRLIIEDSGNIHNEYRDMDQLVKVLLRINKALKSEEGKPKNKDLKLAQELKNRLGYISGEKRFK